LIALSRLEVLWRSYFELAVISFAPSGGHIVPDLYH